jgi:hypothetical protein
MLVYANVTDLVGKPKAQGLATVDGGPGCSIAGIFLFG